MEKNYVLFTRYWSEDITASQNSEIDEWEKILNVRLTRTKLFGTFSISHGGVFTFPNVRTFVEYFGPEYKWTEVTLKKDYTAAIESGYPGSPRYITYNSSVKPISLGKVVGRGFSYEIGRKLANEEISPTAQYSDIPRSIYSPRWITLSKWVNPKELATYGVQWINDRGTCGLVWKTIKTLVEDTQEKLAPELVKARLMGSR